MNCFACRENETLNQYVPNKYQNDGNKLTMYTVVKDKMFIETKCVISNRKFQDRQYNDQQKINNSC